MDLSDKITEVVCDALGTHSQMDVLSALTTNFVGLVVAMLESQGQDPEKPITLDAGSTGRSITIHAAGATLQ